MELQGVMRTSYGKATQCTGSPWIDEPKIWIIWTYLRSCAELRRPNWNSESCTINTRESSKEISQRRDSIHAKQAHSVVLRVPWVPYSMGDTQVLKVNMRWTSMKFNKNPWTACHEAFVLASVVELLRTSAWLGLVFRFMLHVVLSWATLDKELQPTGKPAMFLFDLWFILTFQRLTQRCFEVQPLHPPGHARQVPRPEASFLDDQRNHSMYCVLHSTVDRIRHVEHPNKSSSQALGVYEVWWWSWCHFFSKSLSYWQRPRPETPSVSGSKNSRGFWSEWDVNHIVHVDVYLDVGQTSDFESLRFPAFAIVMAVRDSGRASPDRRPGHLPPVQKALRIIKAYQGHQRFAARSFGRATMEWWQAKAALFCTISDLSGSKALRKLPSKACSQGRLSRLVFFKLENSFFFWRVQQTILAFSSGPEIDGYENNVMQGAWM